MYNYNNWYFNHNPQEVPASTLRAAGVVGLQCLPSGAEQVPPKGRQGAHGKPALPQPPNLRLSIPSTATHAAHHGPVESIECGNCVIHIAALQMIACTILLVVSTIIRFH